MTYYVYENWVHNKAIIHKDSCSFCQSGTGTSNLGPLSRRRDKWLGPYKTIFEAKSAAIKTHRKRIDFCSHCRKS